MVEECKAFFLNEAEELNRLVEYKVINDTVCVYGKYGAHAEIICCNHSSTMGTVLSHDHAAPLYVNKGFAPPEGLRLCFARLAGLMFIRIP